MTKLMPNNSSKILFVDDNEDVLLAAKLLLKSFVETVDTINNPKSILSLMRKNNYDVIFLDMNFTEDMTSGKEGFYWLDKILSIDPNSIVILITAFGDVQTAVKAVKAGATDFVLKPWQNEKLIVTLNSALQLRRSKIELQKFRIKSKQLSEDIDSNFHEIVGKSEGIREVFSTISKVAKTDADVLILGENGTGKELVARALHRESNRANDIFVNVDMGAITPSLFESEFFGHKKGSFTDAKEDRAGRFEVASGGTIFLDEIGNVPIELQTKLLTVLQNRVVTPIGTNKNIPIDIRLICATNMPIHQLVGENKFRQDLLYRINTVEIIIPPLRERKEDIPLLTEIFLEKFKAKYKKDKTIISQQAIKKLMDYNWPGNVRELEHSIERSVILCDSRTISPEDFFFPPNHNKNDNLRIEDFNLENIERQIIKKVLKKNNGNITKAANELGLTRTSLYRRMNKFNL